jgi:hypothetical protein
VSGDRRIGTVRLSAPQRAALLKAAATADLSGHAVGQISTMRNLYRRGLVQQPRAHDAVDPMTLSALLTSTGRRVLAEMLGETFI